MNTDLVDTVGDVDYFLACGEAKQLICSLQVSSRTQDDHRHPSTHHAVSLIRLLVGLPLHKTQKRLLKCLV